MTSNESKPTIESLRKSVIGDVLPAIEVIVRHTPDSTPGRSLPVFEAGELIVQVAGLIETTRSLQGTAGVPGCWYVQLRLILGDASIQALKLKEKTKDIHHERSLRVLDRLSDELRRHFNLLNEHQLEGPNAAA